MSTLCINISRHGVGIYGWQLLSGGEPVDSDDGDSSISDCLSAASSGLPDDVDIVEVKYRGVHMGTFRKASLQEEPGNVADRIVEMFAALVGD